MKTTNYTHYLTPVLEDRVRWLSLKISISGARPIKLYQLSYERDVILAELIRRDEQKLQTNGI